LASAAAEVLPQYENASSTLRHASSTLTLLCLSTDAWGLLDVQGLQAFSVLQLVVVHYCCCHTE